MSVIERERVTEPGVTDMSEFEQLLGDDNDVHHLFLSIEGVPPSGVALCGVRAAGVPTGRRCRPADEWNGESDCHTCGRPICPRCVEHARAALGWE